MRPREKHLLGYGMKSKRRTKKNARMIEVLSIRIFRTMAGGGHYKYRTGKNAEVLLKRNPTSPTNITRMMMFYYLTSLKSCSWLRGNKNRL